MNEDTNKETRLEKIIRKLTENKDLINESQKGSIEVNYSGTSETISIKVVV